MLLTFFRRVAADGQPFALKREGLLIGSKIRSPSLLGRSGIKAKESFPAAARRLILLRAPSLVGEPDRLDEVGDEGSCVLCRRSQQGDDVGETALYGRVFERIGDLTDRVRGLLAPSTHRLGDGRIFDDFLDRTHAA